MVVRHKLVLVVTMVILVSGINGCGEDNPTESGGTSDTICLAFTASQDAHVTSYYPDFNNPGAFSLVASHGEPWRENRFYIEFILPDFPENTEVLEAYIHLYEDSDSGTNPGSIGFGRVGAAWRWDQITWNEQPVLQGGFGDASLPNFSGIGWISSGDLLVDAQQIVDSPATNFGWAFSNVSALAFNRSFASLNTREAMDFDKSPRLLLKVKTPTPLSRADVENLIDSSRLANREVFVLFGTDPFMSFLYEPSSGWPDAWWEDVQGWTPN